MSSTWRRRLAVVLPPVVVGVGFLALWELAVNVFEIDAFLLPKPSAIWNALIDDWPVIWSATRTTAYVAITGLLAGSALGILAALVAARFSIANSLLTPLAAAVAAMPIVALAPLFNKWFGITTPTANQAVVTVVVFFPVFVNTAKGLTQVSPSALELMRSYAAGPTTVLRRVRLPNALPFLFGSLRLAGSLSVIAAIVAAYFGGSRDNLGVYITQTAGFSRYANAWAAVLMACVLGLVLFAATTLLERLAMPWHSARRAAHAT